MTLISLLLVLLIDRVTNKTRYWQTEFYTDKYLNVVAKRDWMEKASASWVLLILLFLPTLILFVILRELGGGLFELIVNTAILMICLGCPAVRETYKSFLEAASRGDKEACSLYAEQLDDADPVNTACSLNATGASKATSSFNATGASNESPSSNESASANESASLNESDQGIEAFGQNLVWQNYRHYAAVILWFTALGAAGAVLYVLARTMQSRYAVREDDTAERINHVMSLLDWLPVRITALGFLLVGHFSRAFPTWLGHLPDPAVPAKTLLLSVAVQAEEVEPDENNCAEEPCILVRLAKRNIMFLMTVIAILTLAGWLD